MKKSRKIVLTALAFSAVFANSAVIAESGEDKNSLSEKIIISSILNRSGIVLKPIKISSMTVGREVNASETKESKKVETGASETKESKKVETDASETKESKKVETGASETKESKKVETDASEAKESKKVETDASEAKEEEVSLSETRSVCGLANISASCYLNSLVQLMYHTPTIRSAVLEYTGTHRTTANLKKLFVKMDNTKFGQAISPAAEYAGMGFHHGPDDPQITYLDQFQCDLDSLIDMYSEDNPEKKVLFDFTISPSEKSEKGKSICAASIATSTGGGHYYAAVKAGGKWYRVNDSSVSFIGDEFSDVLKMVKNCHHMVRMVSYE